VQITALQAATGLHRETLTSSTGTYDIPELPVGVYRVTYSEPGFREKVIEGLEQTVGHTRTCMWIWLSAEWFSMSRFRSRSST
jgi:hypothetical protein